MLMRFLPKAEGKSRRLVLVAYVDAAGASALLAGVRLAGIKIPASPTSSLRLDSVESTAFVWAVAVRAIFTIQDSVLIGFRSAILVPFKHQQAQLLVGIEELGLAAVAHRSRKGLHRRLPLYGDSGLCSHIL